MCFVLRIVVILLKLSKEDLQMKKYTIVLLAVALTAVFAVTAMANEWNLYGSARVATFYENNKLGDIPDVAGRDTIKNTTWNLQGNSRIGATVKGDALSARFEFGVSSDGGGGDVTSRRLFGVWQFSDGWGLKVGKDYTPITFFLSGQVFGNDAGLLNVGNAYGSRRGQLAIEGQGFKIALIDNAPIDSVVIDPIAGDGVDFAGAASESYFPKIEASYLWKHGDLGGTHFFGGFSNQKYYVNQLDAADVVTNTFSKTAVSWVFGLGGEYNFGPMFVKPQLSYYVNGAQGGWLGGAIANAAGQDTSGGIEQGPVIIGTEIIDANSFMGMLALGFSPTEQLTLELGGGFLYNNEKDETVIKDHTYFEMYLNAVWTMAPGVFLVPEAGFRDFGELKIDVPGTPDIDLGSLWYFGAKWQINF
jgi:hypothetical protein